MGRPLPPPEVAEAVEGIFLPAHDLAAWVNETFIAEDGDLVNAEHSHLEAATIGFLWTNVANTRQMRRVLGQCERGQPQGSMGKWAKARAEQQVIAWFGDVPDFIITIDATHAATCSDIEFCALIDHELYHAGQELDAFGSPKFRQDGRPAFTMRGHDVEEFIGVVRRYGVVSPEIEALVSAAKGRPEIGMASISQACGTCMALKAA